MKPSIQQKESFFNYKELARKLAALNNGLELEIYHLNHHVKTPPNAFFIPEHMKLEQIVNKINVYQSNIRRVKKEIWNTVEAEEVFNHWLKTKSYNPEGAAELLTEIEDWLTEHIAVHAIPESVRDRLDTIESTILVAVEHGWELLPEPPDYFGEPPMTMDEYHEAARQEKQESRM